MKEFPVDIINLATRCFTAENSGLTGPEMVEHFREYNQKIEEYWKRAKGSLGTRKEIFKECLKSLSPDDQVKSLLDLCALNDDWPSKSLSSTLFLAVFRPLPI